MIVFSIIAPIYNEIGNLEELYKRLRDVMESVGESWELLLIDDGSTDGSTEVIRQLAQEDECVRPVIFARNFGHQLAVTAGLDYSRGQAVVIIDADLQDPPEVILDMIAKWRAGYEVVYAVRAEREGENWFKMATASLFYRIIYKITDVNIPLDAGDFRLLDRSVVDILNRMRERHRFLRGMSVWVGFRQTGVNYRRATRYSGTTKYPFRKMAKFATDAITSFSYFLTGSQAFFGQATTLIAVLLLGGVQLISLGILGEYIGRLYDEAKGRPLYIVKEAPDMEED